MEKEIILLPNGNFMEVVAKATHKGDLILCLEYGYKIITLISEKTTAVSISQFEEILNEFFPGEITRVRLTFLMDLVSLDEIIRIISANQGEELDEVSYYGFSKSLKEGLNRQQQIQYLEYLNLLSQANVMKALGDYIIGHYEKSST